MKICSRFKILEEYNVMHHFSDQIRFKKCETPQSKQSQEILENQSQIFSRLKKLEKYNVIYSFIQTIIIMKNLKTLIYSNQLDKDEAKTNSKTVLVQWLSTLTGHGFSNLINSKQDAIKLL